MSKHEKKDWNKFKQENNQEMQDMDVDHPEHSEAALDHPSYGDLEDKLTQAEQKAHENWEKSVRALAELDNVRRRAEREVSNAYLFGQEKLVTSLLPVVDSLEQAVQLAEKNADTGMQEGLELTMKLLLDLLEKNAVKQLDPVGMPFDPQQHEAMSMQEVEGVAANTVLTVYQKGYSLNDRVIRPARVIVSKGKAIS